MADLIQEIEKEQLRDDSPDFAPGDTIRVLYLVREGQKERIQAFEGVRRCRASRSSGAAGSDVRSSTTFGAAAARRRASRRSAPPIDRSGHAAGR